MNIKEFVWIFKRIKKKFLFKKVFFFVYLFSCNLVKFVLIWMNDWNNCKNWKSCVWFLNLFFVCGNGFVW